MTASAGTRVLMLLENTPYPQDRRVRPEAAALTEAGYDVTVIAPAAPGQPWHEVVDGVTAYRYPAAAAPAGILGFIWEYGYSLVASFMLSLAVFVRHRFDIVHAHNPPDLFVFVAAFYKLFGTRFVFDHHDLAPEMYRAKFGGRSLTIIYRVLVWLEALSCRLADHVIVTNESYEAVAAQRGRVPPERITIVRNGPDLGQIRQVDPDPDLRRKGRTIIGFVGAMGVQDGVDYLLRALRHLAYDLGRTDFFCVLIGNGDAWPRLRALEAELGLEQFVWFTGALEPAEFLPYLCAADICVEPGPSNPYNDRSTTIKLMEYMALAKPIVAFDLPEHRFSAREAACYVKPNDELEFARALVTLMDDPESREKMGRFGRTRVESALAWQHSVPHLLKAYEALGPLYGSSRRPQNSRSEPYSGPRTTGGRRRIAHWFEQRGARYIAVRLLALLRRYGITTSRATKRAVDCVGTLARYGCRPTFPTPGQVVGRNGAFCRKLQHLGAELAVHGYHHVDFRALSHDESRRQFAGAAAAYQLNGIEFEGFRCPYLSYTEHLNDAIPNGHFQYSSNEAIWWDVLPSTSGTGHGARALFEALSRFYQAKPSETHLAVPRMSDGLVEIPVCLPDDLQLLDGLKLDQRGMRQAWVDILRQTHRRGELFDLLFHPESFEQSRPALEAVLQEAHDLDPPVWITQLRDINRWWREKSGFAVDRNQDGPVVQLTFRCSNRATILVRNLETREPTLAWFGSYRVVDGRTLHLSRNDRPFIGVATDAPPALVRFLREQGYIVNTGPEAADCATYLTSTTLAGVHNQVELIDLIETSPAPLVRFWRWPASARSALCVTGDLDALSLTDYVRRVFAFS